MNAALTLLHRLLLPRSLRARLILLVLGAVLLAQVATLTTVSYFRHKFMEDVAIGYIVTTIRTLRAAVSKVPAEDRADFVHNVSQNQWRLWARTLPADARLQRFNGPNHASRNHPKPTPELGPHESARPRHPSRSEADDMRSNLRVLVRQLNELTVPWSLFHAGPCLKFSFPWRRIPTTRTCPAYANGWSFLLSAWTRPSPRP